jgi:orotidine-5'-phosphate decarboxylase
MATDKVIVALDVDTTEEALKLVRELREAITFFKVGSQLFTREGPEVVRKIRAEGVDVFLDLKFHDIPQTVIQAVRAVKDLGCRFLTVHASGGAEMMLAAQLEVKDGPTQLLGVTVLTSLDDDALRVIGFDHSVMGQTMHLARLATTCGLAGLVCSANEVGIVKSQLSNVPLKLVTPGIRLPDAEPDDQRRTMTPREAMEEGADFLVVGRPITKAANPLGAAQAVLRDCRLG